MSDQTMSDGRTFLVLTVVDEYTGAPLLVLVSRRINSAEVIRQLQILFARHGVPRHIRSDNRPEFIAKRLRAHLNEHRVETPFAEPGCPWQNGIVESFNGRLRDECMDVEAFYSLAEAKMIIEDYRRHYRDQRPHSSLSLAFSNWSFLSRRALSAFMPPDWVRRRWSVCSLVTAPPNTPSNAAHPPRYSRHDELYP